MSTEARAFLKQFRTLFEFAEQVEKNTQLEDSYKTNKAEHELLQAQRDDVKKELQDTNTKLKAAKLELESMSDGVNDIKAQAEKEASDIRAEAKADKEAERENLEIWIRNRKAEFAEERDKASAELRVVQEQIAAAKKEHDSIVDAIVMLKQKIGA